MCHKITAPGASSPTLGAGAIEVFLNVLGNVGFPAAVFRQPLHQLNELLGGGAGLWLWQCRAQLRHHFIAYSDLNLCLLPFAPGAPTRAISCVLR